MSYQDHFRLADDFLTHVDKTIGTLSDPFLRSRYTGFVAVSAVTVFELSMKAIFAEFSTRTHEVLANFTGAFFEKVNGRVALSELRGNYLKKFGVAYREKFDKRLDEIDLAALKTEGKSVKAAYSNLVTWRNEFAHDGRVPENPTYEEVKASYQLGKRVIDCLAEVMNGT
jgi:RiboL-PSP-HEPN